jgi:polyhydroxyalkanoate synthesis regulator phasin
MRKKLIIAATAGALGLGGLAVAVPAMADEGSAAGSAVQRITDALSGLVSDGSITQEQADEVASTLSDAGIGDRGGPHGGGPDLEAAATALGMTQEELRTALETEGTTLADVAGQQSVEVDALVDALVAAQQERIAAAVEDGRLTQEEADQRLADLEERITERVNSAMPERGDHGPGGHRGGPADGEGGPAGGPDGQGGPADDGAEPTPGD